MMEFEKQYIGDAVYAETDGYHLILTTDDGSQKNKIYLDSHVLYSLIKLAITNFLVDAKELFEEQYGERKDDV